MAMRGRGSRSGAQNSADLLVCFPSRAQFTLMPKAICSPVSSSEANKLHSHSHKTNLKRMRGRRGHGSPKMWAKTKPMGQDMDEPTSPKVTCAGQVRARPGTGKNWQSVMEEIERIGRSEKKKKPSLVEGLGFKKDVMQFLTCLRSLRLDLSCFGSLPAGADVTSDEDDDEEEEEEEEHESSRSALSKWFKDGEEAACAPPPNALLLMRCSSAPAKTRLEEKEQEHEEEEEERDDSEYYYKISSDIAKETWVVGGTRDVLSRSRSCKR